MQNGINEQRLTGDVLHWKDEERLKCETLCLGGVLQSRQSQEKLLLLPDTLTVTTHLTAVIKLFLNKSS